MPIQTFPVYSPISRFSAFLVGLLLMVGFVGCAANPQYREEHEIQDLRVVFVDQQTLHEEWKTRTGRDGVEIMPFHGTNMPAVKTLKGFFDFASNTLYCPKWNFSVCGHELHHAVLGQFHALD
ncbi:MAG: hypothetical protein MRJ96_08975 [Nitrospirales bacterium]|nr:hypothetical protein [Nitrospira sp.]MDR4501565.1 hypothetical protein [Nitrospirales bacterium]